MKKNFILSALSGIFLATILISNSGGPGNAGNGNRTGAASVTGCAAGGSCHGSAASTATVVNIQLLNGATPVTSYTAGVSYTIKITSGTSSASLPKFGYQACVVTGSGATAGVLIAPGGSHSGSYSGINTVEHSAPLSTTSGFPLNIPWTAPAAGTGTVNIWAVINAVNNDGLPNAADLWNNNHIAITEAISTTVAPITGPTTLCTGSTITLSDATAGGGWLSGNTAVATIGSSTGVVTGVTAGTSMITYGTGITTFTTAMVTVIAGPAPITGVSTPCAGASITLSDATPGGTWSSSNTAVATIGTGGVLAGVTAGTTIVSYTAGSCSATTTVTISSGTPSAIAGPPIVCIGSNITLTNLVSGGTWTSSNTAQATVGSGSGVVTGVALGTPRITYSVSNACGSGQVTRTVSVHASGTCTTGVNMVPDPLFTELQAYPNPNGGTFTLNISSENNEPAYVVVTNLVGEKVKEFIINTNSPQEVRLDRKAAGIYLLSATTAHGRYVAKIRID